MSCSPTYNTLEIRENRFTNAQMAQLLDAACGMVFGNEALRLAVFAMMDSLDAEARVKGEPAGLAVRYGIDHDGQSFGVIRTSDLPEEGDPLVPSGHIEVYIRVREGFPTNEWLGPVFFPRPTEAEPQEMRGTDAADEDPVHEYLRAATWRDEWENLIFEKRLEPSLAQIFPLDDPGRSYARANSDSMFAVSASPLASSSSIAAASVLTTSSFTAASSHSCLTRLTSGVSPP